MTHTPPRRQAGAALLLAMVIVALIVTTAAGMVWLQTRAVQVEAAERARAQSAWILSGALDWARLILKEDERGTRQSGKALDSLDEPWATPLAEARLSTFLAADQDNNADSGPEAFISGSIVDVQSRFNLRGLVDDGKAQVGSGIVAIVGVTEDGKAGLAVGVTTDLVERYSAVELVRAGAEALGGKGGGGRPDMAQAGGPDGSKAEAALEAIEAALRAG